MGTNAVSDPNVNPKLDGGGKDITGFTGKIRDKIVD